MNVRTGVAIASLACLGLIITACSGAAAPNEPSSPASPAIESSEAPEPAAAPAPGVSWLRVVPEQGVPGSAVSLDVACLDNLGTVQSPVLDVGALKGDPEGHQPWHQFGTATIRPDAAPGRYQISATCGAEELSAAFTVVPAASR